MGRNPRLLVWLEARLGLRVEEAEKFHSSCSCLLESLVLREKGFVSGSKHNQRTARHQLWEESRREPTKTPAQSVHNQIHVHKRIIYQKLSQTYSACGIVDLADKRFCFGEQAQPMNSKASTMRREPPQAYQNSSTVNTQSNQCSQMENTTSVS